MNPSRREFIQQTIHQTVAAIAVAGSLSRQPTAIADDGQAKTETETEKLPIVDTHQHLWDRDKFQLPWLAGAPEVLQRSYKMSDYLAATAGLNVVKAVYMEVDVAPQQQVAEAEELISICRAADSPTAKSPTVGEVISGRPNSAEFRDYILRFKDNRLIKGVRQVLHAPSAQRGLCLEPQFVRSIQLLGELGKSFDLCMRPTELADGVKLVDQCPHTRFIVDHCGNADPKAFISAAARGDQTPDHTVEVWKRDMSELARRDQVICKISGVIARVPKGEWKAEILAPIVNYCLDTFGPSRVVFGGDWPVCLLGGSYRRWVESLREIIRERPLAEQKQLLHDNAVRLYALGQ